MIYNKLVTAIKTTERANQDNIKLNDIISYKCNGVINYAKINKITNLSIHISDLTLKNNIFFIEHNEVLYNIHNGALCYNYTIPNSSARNIKIVDRNVLEFNVIL